jgi:hypothetical protein
MKSAVFWDVTMCGSCEICVLQLVIASVHSSLILVTVMIKATFLPNFGYHKSHTASHPRRWNSSSYVYVLSLITETKFHNHMKLKEG